MPCLARSDWPLKPSQAGSTPVQGTKLNGE